MQVLYQHISLERTKQQKLRKNFKLLKKSILKNFSKSVLKYRIKCRHFSFELMKKTL